jgi:protein-tyrosine phosphatase
MTKVLFVCLGNICRSPMAEGLFKDYVEKQGLSHLFHFESRATASWEQGNPVHRKSLDVLHKNGITNMDQKRSKKITERDFLEYDYIIGMDKKNLKFLKEFEDGYYAHKVHLLLPKKEVEDPYITGRYELVFDLIKSSISDWIEKWMEESKNN